MIHSPTKVYCPMCGAGCPHKNGYLNGRQLYKCLDCGRQFGGGHFHSGKRFADAVIADALRQYYEGGTYREVAAHLVRKHRITDTEIAAATVMRWVRTYTSVVFKATWGLEVYVGDEWNFDLSEPDHFGGICWQVSDCSSGFLIAIRYFEGLENISISKLMGVYVTCKESLPRVAYLRSWSETRGLGQAILGRVKNEFPQIEIRKNDINDILANLHQLLISPDITFYNANAPMIKLRSRFKSECSVNNYLSGWQASYNFIKSKENDWDPPGLRLSSPPPIESWLDVIALEKKTRRSLRAGLRSC